jgi:hypothetical protein
MDRCGSKHCKVFISHDFKIFSNARKDYVIPIADLSFYFSGSTRQVKQNVGFSSFEEDKIESQASPLHHSHHKTKCPKQKSTANYISKEGTSTAAKKNHLAMGKRGLKIRAKFTNEQAFESCLSNEE